MTALVKTFDDLSNLELYGILQLREAVFTIEQKCEEPDFDGEDSKASHVFVSKGAQVLACGRFFRPGDRYDNTLYFGRFAVAKSHRGQGLAQEVFQAFIDYAAVHYPASDMILSSQYYIRNFYGKYGFDCVGKTYQEAGIEHIKMVRRESFQKDSSLGKSDQRLPLVV